MKRISICISTIDDRIHGIRNLLDQALPEAEYTVVHQITNLQTYQAFYQDYPAVIFIPMQGKGLSRSRNLALQCATAEWVYLCDDDVIIRNNLSQIAATYGDKYPDAGILCCQLQTSEGDPFKSYRAAATNLSIHAVGSISSAEILIRRTAIQQGHIRFDERFGLGAEFISGEEYLMLRRAMKLGCKVQYVPEVIAIHPALSTGTRYTADLVQSKGAIIAARAGSLYLLFNLIYAWRKWPEYKDSMQITAFLNYIYSGSKRYLHHE
jgi:GT2 family glycosyltransferase